MVAGGNVEGKLRQVPTFFGCGLCYLFTLLTHSICHKIWLCEDKMGGEENLRTVECLRGRLLAERANSRVAKQDADKLGSKLIELEKQLKTEMKSRNKAEKRLKSVMKKLQSLNIFYVSDESEASSFMEKSEISSISSTASSFMKQEEEDKEPHTKITNSANCEIKEPLKKIESPVVSENMKQIVPHTICSDQSHTCDSNEEDLGTSIYENPTELEASQNCHDSKTDDHSTNSPAEINGDNDQDWEDSVDNSLALVLVDTPLTTKPTTDPPMASGSVKEVLDNLRYIREKIQSTMERRRMIRVGSR